MNIIKSKLILGNFKVSHFSRNKSIYSCAFISLSYVLLKMIVTVFSKAS